MCNEIAISLFKNVLLKDISNKQCFHNRRMSLYCFMSRRGTYCWHIIGILLQVSPDLLSGLLHFVVGFVQLFVNCKVYTDECDMQNFCHCLLFRKVDKPFPKLLDYLPVLNFNSLCFHSIALKGRHSETTGKGLAIF